MSVYLLAAYAVFWLLPFLFLLSMWMRQRYLEHELAELSAQLSGREKAIGRD
ncbi:MAG: hypothetical protein ACUVWR_10940 [Anaerolineae bacterium]